MDFTVGAEDAEGRVTSVHLFAGDLDDLLQHGLE
jgi:hypothetical protein